MDVEQIKAQLREIFVAVLRSDVPPEAVGDSGLINQLGIDSIRSLEILIWVEDHFRIEVADEDLSVGLIDSLDVLARYVADKRASTLDESA